MTHSPTPWEISEKYFITSGDKTIGYFDCLSADDKFFIITAVNAYDANQALIKQLVEALDDLETEARIYHGKAREALEAARKAGF